MPNILVQFADAVKGCFTAFDGMISRGRIMPPCTDSSATGCALNGTMVLFKDWKEYSERTAGEIISHAEKTCAGLGRSFISLDTQEERDGKKESKEARARECLGESPLPDGCGLACVLSAVENGRVAKLKGRGFGKPSPGLSNGRRKHLCYYFAHEKYGFMYAKAMAWLPFAMETCINGRETLKKDFEDAGIACETYGDCFTGISDVEKAQSISDAFASEDHSAGFEKTAGLANPFYGTVKSQAGEGCSRFIQQGEAATGIMFVDSERLQNIYSSIVGFALDCFSRKDVSRFMGKKSANGYQGEVKPGLGERPRGIRWKACMKPNSVKPYGKPGVPRVEATINNAREFKEKKRVFNEAGEFVKRQWVPMKKGIPGMPRRLEVGRACSNRLVGELDGIIPRGDAIKGMEKASARTVVNGRSVAGPSLMDAATYSIPRLVASEDCAVQGFRNKGIAPRAFPGMEDGRKRSAKTSRLIRKLRDHGLLGKAPRSSRCLVSKNGRMIISSLIQMKEAMFPMAAEQARIMGED